MPIETMPLAVGLGMDRMTGAVAVNPAAPVDARNIYALAAKMSLRPGLAGTGFPPLAWGTDILECVGMEATLDELFVVYDRPSREIRIFRLDTENGTLQTIASPANGLWGTLDAEAEFPVVVAAEADGMMFFAHCEAEITNRLPCVYYTPDDATPANVGTLTTYEASLRDAGPTGPIYPTFVFAYLDYLCFVGYGDDLDPDRGDMVRMSQPTAPLDLRPPNFFLCGVKKDPIIALGVTNGPSPISAAGLPAAGQATVLVCAKADKSFVLNGTNFGDFVPTLLDPRYGVVSARAFQNINGILHGWASDGVRRFVANTTVSIAQPLELASPLPEDFPPLGPSRLCFSSYDVDRRLASWLFPNSEQVSVPVAEFLLSLWDPENPRWTFSERQQPVSCAGVIFGRDTGSLPPPPVGWVSDITAADAGISADARYRSVLMQWVNNEQTGSEIVQVFARALGGSWNLVMSIAVGGGPEQSAVWDTAAPLTQYDLAFRYMNGVTPAVGYESSDPDSWTAATAPGSKASVTTSSEAVSWVSGSFTSPSAPVNLVWTSVQQNVPYLLEKSNDGGSTWTTVASGIVANTFAYAVPPGELNTTVEFRVTAENGLIVGPTAGVLSVAMMITIGTPSGAFLGSNVATAPSTVVTLYASWSRGSAGDRVQYLQATATPAVGAVKTSPIVGCSAPAEQDVAPQPDGYVPVTAISFSPGQVSPSTGTAPWTFQVRAGVDDGSGGITWGAYQTPAIQLGGFAAAVPAPVVSAGAISSSVQGTQTVAANDLGAIGFDVGDPWLMMKAMNPVGTNSYSLNILSTWHGRQLYITGFQLHSTTSGPPVELDGQCDPVRTLVGTVP